MRRRVLSFPLERWVDPATAHAAVVGDATNSVWLDSAADAAEGAVAARRSYIGIASRVVTDGDFGGSPFDFLRAQLAENPVDPGEGFRLGWVGWLGYELRFETLGQQRNRSSRYPDAAFAFLDRVIEFDHAAGTVALLALSDGAGDWPEDAALWRDVTAGILRSTADAPADTGITTSGSAAPRALAAWSVSDAEYLTAIDTCIAAIGEGEAYQLCLTAEARVDGVIDPVAVYRALRTASPSHHGALIRIGRIALLSASPEQFLAVSPDGWVESRPIKGTRRRGVTPTEDAELRAELVASDKERAENLMIVDLMRNDIGRVSEIGSVEVPSLLAVESYPHVHQLVSTVRGRLAPGLSAVDAVVACFPAGSMTGAPKYSATSILDGLECRARGPYAGAAGYFSLDGRVDLAVVIRSIVVDAEGATVGAGGGITALSDPVAELDEVKLKARAMLAALGFA